MLKLKFENKIVLGLDKENIKRLTGGQPIHIKGKDLKIIEDVYIIYGPTLADIAKAIGAEHLFKTREIDGQIYGVMDLSDEGKNNEG